MKNFIREELNLVQVIKIIFGLVGLGFLIGIYFKL